MFYAQFLLVRLCYSIFTLFSLYFTKPKSANFISKLISLQEKLGLAHDGDVYAVYDYDKVRDDELSFKNGDRLTVTRKGDENEVEWWWSKTTTSDENEGYIPRNLLGLYPRVQPLHQNGGRGGLTVIQEEGKENEVSSKEEYDDAAMSSN